LREIGYKFWLKTSLKHLFYFLNRIIHLKLNG
jgi:hypothetical protein